MIIEVQSYVDRVLSGDIVAGPYVRAACDRHSRDLRNSDIYFDDRAAALALDFFREVLRLSVGDFDGQPFDLLEWEVFVVASLHGWKRNATGYRRYLKAYLEVAKGNGKTPLCAGLALYGLTADRENQAEGFVAARTADQALATFRPLCAMVRSSPLLSERLNISGGKDSPYNVSYYETMSFIRRISSDKEGRGKSGPIPHIILLDEYHEQESPAMLNFLDAGTKMRKQPLTIVITNAGDTKQSPCGQEHDYAVKVAQGELEDETYFAFVCALDEDDDPFEDEGCWPKANPSLPTIPGYDYLRIRVNKARGMPSLCANVERLNFCIWTDATAPWVSRKKWVAVEVPELDEAEIRDAPCYGGLDLALKKDLCAGALTWDVAPGEKDPQYRGRIAAWTPDETIKNRAAADGAPYVQWAEDGHLVATPGPVIRFDFVARWIEAQMNRYNLVGFAYDPAHLDRLEEALDNIGIETTRNVRERDRALLLAGHPQGFVAGMKNFDIRRAPLWMPRSIEALEATVLSGHIRVEYNPVLRWAALGATLIADASANRRMTKTKSKTRIDPIVALTMATGFADATLPEPEVRDVSHYTMGDL